MRTIRVITFRVGEPARVEMIDGSGYKGLGAIVGGWIERVPNAYWERPDDGDDGLDLYCNEEGLLVGLSKQVREELASARLWPATSCSRGRTRTATRCPRQCSPSATRCRSGPSPGSAPRCASRATACAPAPYRTPRPHTAATATPEGGRHDPHPHRRRARDAAPAPRRALPHPCAQGGAAGVAMKANCTPTPWVRGDPEGTDALATIRTADGENVIAEVYFAEGHGTREQAEADLAHMLAAPALAKALKDLTQATRDLLNFPRSTIAPDMAREALTAADLALLAVGWKP